MMEVAEIVEGSIMEQNTVEETLITEEDTLEEDKKRIFIQTPVSNVRVITNKGYWRFHEKRQT
jgi:hypothetical protein